MNFKNLLEKLRILFLCKVLSKILIPQSKLCFDSAKKKTHLFEYHVLFMTDYRTSMKNSFSCKAQSTKSIDYLVLKIHSLKNNSR